MKKNVHLKWNKTRKFGIELEFNSPNNNRLTDIINQNVEGERAIQESYHHNIDNEHWACKTDSSCGYEVAGRVCSGFRDVRICGQILDTLIEHGATFNNSCGQHVHVNTEDFSREEIEKLTAWWVKIEHFIINAHPEHRRINSYCRPANHQLRDLSPNQVHDLSNVFSFINSDRGALNLRSAPQQSKTIEFRFGHMIESGEELKNRIRFLVWFVDTVKNLPAPDSLNWLDPKQTFQLLGLWNDGEYVDKTFSPAILGMKKWILKGSFM